MRTMWKFTVPGHPGVFSILVPKYTSFLSVSAQHGYISIWGEVSDTQEREESRAIEVFETGQAIPENNYEVFYMYLGLASFDNGSYILHVYERMEK